MHLEFLSTATGARAATLCVVPPDQAPCAVGLRNPNIESHEYHRSIAGHLIKSPVLIQSFDQLCSRGSRLWLSVILLRRVFGGCLGCVFSDLFPAPSLAAA